MHTRQEWRCLERCQTTVRRVVWDGDAILYEIQAPGGTGESAAEMEADVGLAPAVPAYSYESRTIYDNDAEPPASDSVVTPQDGADGYYYGRVLYTHGGGMDAPLSVTRMEYSDSLRAPMTVFLHRDWRGTHDLGTFAGNGTQPPCVTITVTKRLREPVEGQEPHGQDPPAGTPSEHCWDIDWPAPYVEITGRTYERSLVGAAGWSGSQIDGMRDASGLMYRRNRYYDPSSGRFTQEDPIGIAGGLNVYGFAEGDPVTYSDPYGLCPGIPGTDQLDILDCPPGYFTVVGAALGGTAGGIGGGIAGGIGGGAVCSPGGPVAVGCAAGGALAGTGAGAAAGIKVGAVAGAALDAGVFLFSRRADALELAGALSTQIEEHLAALEGGDDNAWRHHSGETRGFINQVRDKVRHMGRRTGREWSRRLEEYERRLNQAIRRYNNEAP